jgi:hypothetical protein
MHSSHVNLSFHIHVGTGKRSEEKAEYIYTAHCIEHFCVLSVWKSLANMLQDTNPFSLRNHVTQVLLLVMMEKEGPPHPKF